MYVQCILYTEFTGIVLQVLLIIILLKTPLQSYCDVDLV